MVNFKLGRQQPNYLLARLWAEDYYRASLPAPKQTVDFSSKVKAWPMYGNDRLGDCTWAGAAHSEGAVSTYARGNEVVFTDAEVTGPYNRMSPNDTGCMMSDVVNAMVTDGIAGNKWVAGAQMRSYDELALNQALQLFGTVYLGIMCTQSMQDQFANGEVLDYVPGSRVLGGHCIVLQAIEPLARGDYTVVTWGQAVRCTRTFLSTYIEEAWAVLSKNWLELNGHTISGLDVQALRSDMEALAR